MFNGLAESLNKHSLLRRDWRKKTRKTGDTIENGRERALRTTVGTLLSPPVLRCPWHAIDVATSPAIPSPLGSRVRLLPPTNPRTRGASVRPSSRAPTFELRQGKARKNQIKSTVKKETAVSETTLEKGHRDAHLSATETRSAVFTPVHTRAPRLVIEYAGIVPRSI